ncbi:hypothetical protein ACSBR1_030554 [Camellia fascicularis]
MKQPHSVGVAFSISFSLFFFIITSPAAAAAADISPGSTLKASNPNHNWTSPNTTFSLSFISDDGSSFFAAITYNGIPVWIAGASDPGGGASDSSASLQFLADGNLRLVNGSSSSAVVWQSNTAGRGVSSAALDDSGNFVLRNATVSVWSTFDYPTDTILPSQNFTIDKVLRSGLYSFSLLSSGNLTLKWNNTILYWNLGLNSSFHSNLTSPNLVLQSIGALSLHDQSLSSPVAMVYSSDYAEGSDIIRFLKLENDGNLRIYSTVKGTRTSIVRWVAVKDQCQVFGYCGNMGICSYNDSKPICICPSMNFVPIDPKDSRKGCKRKMNIEDCPKNVTMLQLNHTEFLTYPPDIPSQIFFMSTSTSRLNCITSSPCIAATSLSDGTGRIYMKFPGFVSGYRSPTLPSTSFLKVCGPIILSSSVSSPRRKDWRLHARIVLVVVIGTTVGFILLEAGLWLWCRRRSSSPKYGGFPDQYAFVEYESSAPVQFSYKELQCATKGFKEKLGKGGGGLGAVYKGVIANGTVVAVKRLEGIEQGERQFKMEVATISSTHHVNLVRLIGFCSTGRHRLLVYEFMKDRSLDMFLFSPEEKSGKLLSWDCRFNIARGTARGIKYLHEECRDCIVHCDIKPENILLDENFNAKVSDFGLARLIKPRDHRYRTLTSFRGNIGYLAPEWAANLPITSKADVYSYGIVLLEIVSGRRNFEFSSAYEEFERGNVMEIVDARLVDDHKVDMEQVMRAIQVSFWCIQEEPSKRPTMGRVAQMLEGIVEIEKPPAPKAVEEMSVIGTIVNGRNVERASSSLLRSEHKWSSDC